MHELYTGHKEFSSKLNDKMNHWADVVDVSLGPFPLGGAENARVFVAGADIGVVFGNESSPVAVEYELDGAVVGFGDVAVPGL